MKFDFNKFLNSLNTHHVFGVGLGTAMGSIAIIALQPKIDAASLAHLGGFGQLVNSYVDITAEAAKAALPPAILAAAFGRPPNVPKGPVKPL